LITVAQAIIYSTDPSADRAFLRDVLKFPHVEAGADWLIFSLPPEELAVHPSDQNDRQEIFLICDDVRALVQALLQKNVICSQIQDQSWGQITYITIPGGGRLGVYQPTHARPDARKRSGRSGK